MTDRLTDAELDRLEAMAADPWPWELNDFVDAMLHEVPALLAEVREHRAREAAHRVALDVLVDGDDR